MKKLILPFFGIVACSLLTPSCHKATTADIEEEPSVYYLFSYFPSNRDENLYYAISENGFDYTPLNGGRMVLSADTVALKKGIRDPYVTRGQDGKFYMVTTDMKSAEGWDSNRGMVLFTSDDLINWNHSAVHFPERFPQWKNVTRVWAPEMIWDPNYVNEDGSKGRYMVYFSLLTDDGTLNYDKIFYSYANDDFTDLLTDPVLLYDGGNATIDGDIVFNEKDNLYYMFFKDEAKGGIIQVTSPTLTAAEGQEPGSQWSERSKPVQQTDVAVEGAGIFKLDGTDTWVLMYDCYGNGFYQFCTSEDLVNFKLKAQTQKHAAFTPRHGSVIPISKEEKDRLLEVFPIPAHDGNPVLSGYYADPEILYSKKTKMFYLYPTTDGTPGWGGHEFYVFSSPNLIDWKKENLVLDLATDDVTWATGNAWAPSIIEKKEKDGYKYYFYFSGHNPETGKKSLGYAVADSPVGPFKDSGKPFVTENITEGQLIDSDVFMDPATGDTYFYWGNGRLVASKLSPDMTSFSDAVDITPEGGTLQDYAFREGVYVFERNGKYYFLWSVDDTGSPNYHIAYGTADSPMGPIKVAENPVILIQDPENGIYGTGHCSVIQIPDEDQWYIVYHRINKDHLQDGPGFHREVCIDRLEFNEDGSIKPVVPTHDGIIPVRA